MDVLVHFKRSTFLENIYVFAIHFVCFLKNNPISRMKQLHLHTIWQIYLEFF